MFLTFTKKNANGYLFERQGCKYYSSFGDGQLNFPFTLDAGGLAGGIASAYA